MACTLVVAPFRHTWYKILLMGGASGEIEWVGDDSGGRGESGGLG